MHRMIMFQLLNQLLENSIKTSWLHIVINNDQVALVLANQSFVNG